MNLVHAARRLDGPEPPDAEGRYAYCGGAAQVHRGDCPWPLMPQVAQALEVAEEIAHRLEGADVPEEVRTLLDRFWELHGGHP